MAEPEVTIGRLRKKVHKLIKQRDHWKSEADRLTEMLRLYPFIERGWEDHLKRKEERKRLRELEATQAVLVDRLERTAREQQRSRNESSIRRCSSAFESS
jgi:hypothetical protein